MATTVTGAEQVEWNLSDLFDGPDVSCKGAEALTEKRRGPSAAASEPSGNVCRVGGEGLFVRVGYPDRSPLRLPSQQATTDDRSERDMLELYGLLEQPVEEQALKDEVEGQKGRIDAAVRDTQDRYLGEKQERDAAFGAALEEQRSQAEQARTESQTLFSQERERLKTATDAALAQLEGQKAKAREIVGLLGNTGLTGHYQRIANREMWAAYGWIGIALAAFALAVLTHLFFPGWDLGAATSWDDVLPKVVVSVPLILFGLFAISESRMHRGREQSNRDMELQLASVDPYLESIPEKAEAIKDRMFERFFSGRAQPRPPDDEDTSPP